MDNEDLRRRGSKMTIKIDKNIPLPETRNRYPFDKLEVGNSFFVEGKTNINGSRYHYVRKNHGKKFTTKRENGGLRVWRIK